MPDLSAVRHVILQKKEATYGVDPTPVAATDALLVHNFQLRPLIQMLADRDPALRHFRGRSRRVLANYMVASFDVEFSGRGTVDGPVQYSPLLQSAGCSEVISATVKVTHAPITDAIPSVAMYSYLDGVLHKLLGGRSNAKITVPGNAVPMVHFDVTGLYVAVSDAAMPASPDLSRQQLGVVVSKANTTPMTLHTYAGVFSSFELDLGNEIDYVNLPNQEEVKFIGAQPRGTCELAATLVATKDWWTLARAETLGAFAMTHGTVAGNIVKVDGAQVKILEPEYTTRNKIRYLRLGLDFDASSAGNDNFALTTQ